MNELAPGDSVLLAEWNERRCERSFRMLVDRYVGLVHQAALRRTGSASLAADASQATFLLLAQKASSLIERRSLAGWLHLTSVHHSRNLLRNQMRENRKRQLLAEQIGADEGQSSWAHIQPELDEALARLPDLDREALLLRYYRALSVQEVADDLGITLEAAKKRLVRALDRLRGQLAGRGCALSSNSLGAGLMGLSADVQAGAVLSNMLGNQVLATYAATSVAATPLTSIIIAIMTKKIAIIAGSAVVLLGIGTYAVLHEAGKSADASSTASNGRRVSEQISAVRANAEDSQNPKKAARKRPEDKWGDLADRYGDSRTKLANHVGRELGGAISDMSALVALMPEGAGIKVPDEALEALQLTPEQEKEVGKLVMARQLEKFNKLAENISKDPRDLMDALLAGDAYTRGQISKEEYEARASKVADALAFQKIFEKNGSEDAGPGVSLKFDVNPATDPTFYESLSSILTPQQREELDRARSEDKDHVAEKADIPVATSLDTIEQSVTAARRMLSGMKMAMEGAQGRPEVKVNGGDGE